MASENCATITIDGLAQEMFPKEGEPMRRYGDVLGELLERLQDKGDDPRYSRVIFAGDKNQGFLQINETDLMQTGVFVRYLGFRHTYEGRAVPNTLSVKRSTLIVAANEEAAQIWKEGLDSAGYNVDYC